MPPIPGSQALNLTLPGPSSWQDTTTTPEAFFRTPPPHGLRPPLLPLLPPSLGPRPGLDLLTQLRTPPPPPPVCQAQGRPQPSSPVRAGLPPLPSPPRAFALLFHSHHQGSQGQLEFFSSAASLGPGAPTPKPGLRVPVGCGPPLRRYLAGAARPTPRPTGPARPVSLSRRAPPPSAAGPPLPLSPGPTVPAAQAGASCRSHSAQGFLAATRPLLAGIGGASLALPACPSFEPPSIAGPAPASLPRSGPFLRAGPSEWPPALAALPVSRALKQFGTRGPGRQCAPFKPGSSDRPRRSKPSGLSPAPRSPILRAAFAHQPALPRLGTRGLSSRRGRPRASVRLGGPGPGLLALGRDSQPRPPPPSGRAIPGRRFGIRDSAAPLAPSVSSVPTAGPSFQLLPPGPCPSGPRPGLLASPPAPPSQAAARLHLPICSPPLLCTARSVTEFMFRPDGVASSAPGWALPQASRPRPPCPPAAGPPPLVARGSPSPRDLPHTPLSRTPIWALTARPHSSNRAGGALGPEAELFAGAASRDVASMVVAAATSQNQQLRARQASGAAILGRCASPRVAPAGRHLEKVSS